MCVCVYLKYIHLQNKSKTNHFLCQISRLFILLKHNGHISKINSLSESKPYDRQIVLLNLSWIKHTLGFKYTLWHGYLIRISKGWPQFYFNVESNKILTDLNSNTRDWVHLALKITNRKSYELSWICCLTSQLTIFQSYMWRHIDVQADWRRSWTYGRAPNAIDISQGSLTCRSLHRHGTTLFIRWFRHTAPFSRLLRSRWGYGGHILDLTPQALMGPVTFAKLNIFV